MTSLIKSFVLIALCFPTMLLANEVATEVQKVPDVMGVGNVLQIVAGLFVVLMMIVGAAWMLKRYGGLGGVSNANLKVVAGINVGQREKIVVVQAGEVQVLVGISPGNIRTLHVLEQHISDESSLKTAVSEGDENSDGFIGHLRQQVEKRVES